MNKYEKGMCHDYEMIPIVWVKKSFSSLITNYNTLTVMFG